MTIKELEDKHFKIGIKKYHFPIPQTEHTKLSIEFAISILEEIINGKNYSGVMESLRYKVEELKKQLL